MHNVEHSSLAHLGVTQCRWK